MNADENIRNALFFNVLKYAWSLTLDSSINTILTVDEAHVLLSGNNTLGADFLATNSKDVLVSIIRELL